MNKRTVPEVRDVSTLRVAACNLIAEIGEEQPIPRVLRLTREHEMILSNANSIELGGELVGNITVHGVRDALTTFVGLEIEWDADELGVA